MIDTSLRPPTDNLYKFIALSGLLLFLVSVWFYGQFAVQLVKIDNELDQLAKLSGTRFRERVKDGLRKIAQDIDDGVLKDKQTTMSTFDELVQGTDMYTDPEIDQAYELMSRRVAIESSHYPESLLLKLGIGLGLVLATGGFVSWYRLVQRPLDELLQLELKAARAGDTT